MNSMDFMSDKEFNELFDRISRIVDLEGAGSPEEIIARLNQKVEKDQYLSGKNELTLFHARGRIPKLKKLISGGFARRTIDEAIANPRGKIALTLKYGRERAKDILLKRARRRLRW